MAAVAQDSPPERVVLGEGVSKGLKWESGTLTSLTPGKIGDRKLVTVKFKVQDYRLSFLSITYGNSVLDLSDQVNRLFVPAIQRLFVVMSPGNDHSARISLPYVDFSKEIGKQCTSLEIQAEGAKVLSAKSFDTDAESCEP
jgi:hypothetical protein